MKKLLRLGLKLILFIGLVYFVSSCKRDFSEKLAEIDSLKVQIEDEKIELGSFSSEVAAITFQKYKSDFNQFMNLAKDSTTKENYTIAEAYHQVCKDYQDFEAKQSAYKTALNSSQKQFNLLKKDLEKQIYNYQVADSLFTIEKAIAVKLFSDIRFFVEKSKTNKVKADSISLIFDEKIKELKIK